MPVFLDYRVQGFWCHGVELPPSLLQKVNSELYMCSYCYKELKASGNLRIWDVNAMYDRLCHLNIVHYNSNNWRCMEQHVMVLTTLEHRSICIHFQVFAKILSGVQEFRSSISIMLVCITCCRVGKGCTISIVK